MNKFLFLLSAFLISGCAAVQQAQLNSGMKQAEQAMASCGMQSIPPELKTAWDTVSSESEAVCLQSPVPPEQAGKQHQCWAGLVNKHVRPIDKKPKALNKLVAKSKEVSISYRDGKLSRNTSNQTMGTALTEYMTKQASYYDLVQCRNTALQQHVMPSYPHKGLLMSFMAEQSEIGLKVDQGKMSPKQADIAVQKAFSSLLASEQVANNAVQRQNARAWQQSFENMQRIEENNQRALRANRPVNTNCSRIGNSVNCTTW